MTEVQLFILQFLTKTIELAEIEDIISKHYLVISKFYVSTIFNNK
ncbi:hypothetical protein H1P_210032 [Hyella patelloides LEGE 07179]|uniref:Uncharacterized protein n=1 Tax=Hyella patelloides LEGE 07179 TaxID=945734 RepID=A0A563VQG8_9CYAN|nr:hypothetical protein H1P_210032 [Hyella patelloides LEGE 07179]